ncbi:MAG: 2OG-Fe(II) oxygenase [Burkholderiales bacterium]|nr:2OG-Fe(II) oxygenase [Burkholderiales bacterium]
MFLALCDQKSATAWHISSEEAGEAKCTKPTPPPNSQLSEVATQTVIAINNIVNKLDSCSSAENINMSPCFDGLPSVLFGMQLREPELRIVAELIGKSIVPPATYLHIPVGGYLLPIRMPGFGSRAKLIFLEGGPSDGVTIAGANEVRRHLAKPGDVIPLEGDGWYWISPVKTPLSLLSLGLLPEDQSGSRANVPSPLAPVRILKNSLPQAEEIAELALAEGERFISYPKQASNRPFDPWRGSEDENDDHYHVLPMRLMSVALRRQVAEVLTPLIPSAQPLYFQINRYDTGNFVLPHRDDFPQSVCVLRGHSENGLIVQSNDRFVVAPDEPGTAILSDARAWHWVDPVLRGPRLSLVTIPPIFTRETL